MLGICIRNFNARAALVSGALLIFHRLGTFFYLSAEGFPPEGVRQKTEGEVGVLKIERGYMFKAARSCLALEEDEQIWKLRWGCCEPSVELHRPSRGYMDAVDYCVAFRDPRSKCAWSRIFPGGYAWGYACLEGEWDALGASPVGLERPP